MLETFVSDCLTIGNFWKPKLFDLKEKKGGLLVFSLDFFTVKIFQGLCKNRF